MKKHTCARQTREGEIPPAFRAPPEAGEIPPACGGRYLVASRRVRTKRFRQLPAWRAVLAVSVCDPTKASFRWGAYGKQPTA